jgi:tRNA threonylcarbamoyladenosine biosynthesis protein TsaB
MHQPAKQSSHFLLSLAGSASPASVAWVERRSAPEDGTWVECIAQHESGEQTGEELLDAVAQWVETWGVPEVLALDVGPGSFTGLRVGLGLAQGLALAWNLLVLPLSSAQIMASRIQLEEPQAHVMTFRDARMGAVYLGDHPPGSLSCNGFGDVTEVDPQEALARLVAKARCGVSVCCVVDPTLEALLQQVRLQVFEGLQGCGRQPETTKLPRIATARPEALQLARLASARLASGHAGIAPTALTPFYVRNDVAMDLAAQRAYRQARAG